MDSAKIIPIAKLKSDLDELLDNDFQEYTLQDPVADQHIRVRKGQFNIILGHPNVGKTTWCIWYYWRLSKLHGLKFSIYSGENDGADIMEMLIQLETGIDPRNLSKEKREIAFTELVKYFEFINDTELYTAEEIVQRFEDSNADICVIDPHNSVQVPKGRNWYEYSFELGMHIRAFVKRSKKTIILVAHPNSESQRKFHKDGDYKGMRMKPNSADIAGGGIWINRADNVYIVHRYGQHKDKWKQTVVDVEKIRHMTNGVNLTMKDNPVIFTRNVGGNFVIGYGDAEPSELDKVVQKQRDGFNDVPF